MPSTKPAPGMRRLTLDVPDDAYFLLKAEALERQKKGEKASVSTLIREAIEERFPIVKSGPVRNMKRKHVA